MALPLPVMASPFGCHSLVEGIPKMIPRIERMDSAPPPHSAPLGGPASASFSCSVLWITLVPALSPRRPAVEMLLDGTTEKFIVHKFTSMN
jgi:hypothetical protein